MGLLCGLGHVRGGDLDFPRPRVLHCEMTNPPILLGGAWEQGSVTWPWNMAQVEHDRLTQVVVVGDQWTSLL